MDHRQPDRVLAAPVGPLAAVRVPAGGGEPEPLFGDTAADSERQGRVSPDGKRIAFVSDRESDDGDVDLWVADLGQGPRDRVTRTRLARVRGDRSIAVVVARRPPRGLLRRARRRRVVWVDRGRGSAAPDTARPRPAEPPVLVSRKGGAPAWSPDGKPDRDRQSAAPRSDLQRQSRFATTTSRRRSSRRRRVPPADRRRAAAGGCRSARGRAAGAAGGRFAAAFDRVWETLRRLYYSSGPAAGAWRQLKDNIGRTPPRHRTRRSSRRPSTRWSRISR